MTVIVKQLRKGIFKIKSSKKTGLYIVRIKTTPTCTCAVAKGYIRKHLKVILIKCFYDPLLMNIQFLSEDLAG